MKANFYLRDVHAKKDTAIILFVSYPSKKRFKYYTGEHTKPINWDTDKQRTKRNVATNGILNTIEEAFQTVYSALVKKGERIDNAMLEKALLVELKRDSVEVKQNEVKEEATTLYSLLEKFIDSRQGLRARATMIRYDAIKYHLLRYEKKHGIVLLKNLNTEFGDSFTSYLFAQGQQRNSVGKVIIGLKVLLNWAVESGYTIPAKYKKFIIPSAPTKIIALTETEFYQFLTVPLPKEEEVTRDLFCFSAFTGLRFSDVVRVTPEMVIGDFLHITTKKTEDTLKVFLTTEAKDILKKYKGSFKGLRTNQGSNKGVKRIAKLAGIDTPLKVTEYYGNKT